MDNSIADGTGLVMPLTEEEKFQDPNPFPSELPQGMTNELSKSYEDKALEPIKEQKREQDARVKERLDTVYSGVRDLTNYEPKLSTAQKQRKLINGLMEVKLGRIPKDVNEYQQARFEFANKYYEGKGGDSDAALFEQIKTDTDKRAANVSLHQSLQDVALVGSLDGKGFMNWLKTQEDTGMSPERKQSMLHSYKEYTQQIQDQYGDSHKYAKKTFERLMGGDVDKAMDYVNQIKGDMNDEEHENYLGLLREVVLANPDPKVEEMLETLGVNVAPLRTLARSYRNTGKVMDSVGDLVKQSPAGIAHAVREGGTYGFAKLFGSDEAAAREKENAARDKILAKTLQKNSDFVADVKRIFRDDYNPIEPHFDGGVMGAIETGVYAAPAALTTTAMLFIPYAGLPLVGSTMFGASREKFRQRILDNGGSREEAANNADALAMITTVPNMMLERLQALAFIGKAPMLNGAMQKVNRLFNNKLARGVGRFTIANFGETNVEMGQEYMEELVQMMGSSFSEVIPDVQWMGEGGVFDGFAYQYLSTAVAVAPLGVTAAVGGVRVEDRAEAYKSFPREIRAMNGVSAVDNDRIDNAETIAETVEAVQIANANADPNSDEAKDAVEAQMLREEQELTSIENLKRAGLFPMIVADKQKDGVVDIVDPQTGDVLDRIDNNPEAAAQAVFSYMELQDQATQEQLDEMSTMIEAAMLDVKETGDKGAKVELDLGNKMDVRGLLEAFPEFEGRLRNQVDRLEQLESQEILNGGDGGMSRAVFGLNQAVHGEDVKSYTNRAYAGTSAMTLVHERGHVSWKRALESGATTLAKTYDFFKELDKSLEGKTDRNGKELRFMPEGTTADNFTALDEAVAEFSEVMLLRTRNGEKTAMRDVVGRQMSAMAKARKANAGSFKGFYQAMQDFFGKVFARNLAFKQAIRSGQVTEGQLNEFYDTLVEANAQEQFERDVDTETQAIIDGESMSIGSRQDADIVWDRSEGWGSVPNQRQIEYFGFTKSMSPVVFRNLVPDGVSGALTVSNIRKEKPSLAPPFLQVDWDDSKKAWLVRDHEGRSRAMYAMYLNDADIPVDLLTYPMRAKGLTEEMKNAPIIPQGGGDPVMAGNVVETGWSPETSFSIGSRQDATYMDAVESGDVETQQSMVDERARSMGYNPLMKLYHGTKKLFDRFKSDRDPNKLIYFSKDRNMAETYPRGYGGHRSPEADVQKRLDDARQESREYVEGALEELGAKYGENDIPQNLVDDVFEKEKAIQRDALDGMTLARAQSEMGIRVIEGYVRADKIFEPANWREFSAEIMESIGVKSESEIDPQMMRMIEEGNYIVWENSKVVDAVLGKYDAMTIQESSGKEANTIAFRDPSQIKSADPVTYDADGNVIPLSQRFDAGRDEISMSLAPAGDTVMDKINALMRDPDTRIEIYKDMASRLRKVRERIYKKQIAYGGVTAESMREAEREMDDREFIIASVAQIEAISKVLPPEVRGKLGTMKKMSEFKTGKGLNKYVASRLDKVDTALENYLRKELRADVSKLIKNSQPKGKQKASDTGQSKLGAVGHRIAEAAKKAVKMSPDEAGLAAQLERAKLDKIEEPTVDEIQEHEDVAYVYEMFADIENADSNRLTMMKRLMQTNFDEGRQQWKAELSKRKVWRESKVGDILTGLNKLFKSDPETTSATEREAVVKSFARELVSFYQITDMLREDMKAEEGSTVKEMADDFRKASNAFEWEQLQHKEAMKKVFSEIFGIKGANKTARVQARLNALAKGVEWGSRVTKSTTYDYKIAANAAELDQAYQQLQADPELDRVDIRDKNISRDEFGQMYIEYQNQVSEGFSPTGRKLFRHTIKRNTGERVTIGRMSQLDMLKDWLAIQQLDLKDKYEKTGHDEQYREEIDEALEDDVKELGLWMQGRLREMTPETEALHRSEYGLSMATVENYFPAVFEHVGKPETSLAIDGIEIAGVSKRPSAHKMRVNHNSRPKRQNAVNVFNHNIMQDAFWKTHAEVLRKWVGVLRDPDVQDGILRAKGDGFLNTMNKWLENIETQGSAVAQAQIESDRVWRSIGKGMALGVLGLKLSTIMKNLAAGFNVALGVDAKYLIKGLRPELFSEARELLKSETFQRRLKMGATVATRYALQGGKAGNLIFSSSERLAEVGIQGINIADTGSNMTMALAYTAKIRELRKEGISEADAEAQALDYIDDLMARFAQPTDRLSKSLAENTRMPQAQFIVMFQSEVRKMMAINAMAIRKLLTGKGVQSKSLAAQQLVVQVVIVNSFIHAVGALYGAMFRGFGEGDDAEEKFIEDLTDGKKLIANIIADSMSGVPVAGEAWAMAVRSALDQDVFTSTSNPLVRSMGGSKQLLTVTGKWDEKSASENADTVMRGIQGLAAVAPQTAVLSQVSNFSRDSLGFLNNALKTGLNKEDTFKLYEKRIKKVTSYVHADTKDEMKKAKDEKDRRMIRSIETQRKEEILGRTRDILLEMKEADRKEFLKQQKDSEKGIQKYIINDARSL